MVALSAADIILLVRTLGRNRLVSISSEITEEVTTIVTLDRIGYSRTTIGIPLNASNLRSNHSTS